MVGFFIGVYMINNDANIPLYLAAWLANDEYDYVSDPKYISATSLMKPIKELILSGRVPCIVTGKQIGRAHV